MAVSNPQSVTPDNSIVLTNKNISSSSNTLDIDVADISGTTTMTIVKPTETRILGYDNTGAGSYDALLIGSGISITGTTPSRTIAVDVSTISTLTALTSAASPAGSTLAIATTAPAVAAASAAGPAMTITGGNATAGNVTAGAAVGSDVTIKGGNAARLTSGNAAGGSVVLDTGSSVGAANNGSINFKNAGTSAGTCGALGLTTKLGGANSLGGVAGVAFTHQADGTSATTVETDIVTDTLAASTFGTNGDKVYQLEHVSTVAHASNARRIRKYLGGVLIWDSGSITTVAATEFQISTLLVRVSSTVVRASVGVTTSSAVAVPNATYTSVTGLTLSSTNILKTTGTGVVNSDIVSRMSMVQAIPAA